MKEQRENLANLQSTFPLQRTTFSGAKSQILNDNKNFKIIIITKTYIAPTIRKALFEALLNVYINLFNSHNNLVSQVQ